MENDEQSIDLFNLMAWAQQNRQRLITIAIVVVVLGSVIGIYFWHKNHVEMEASTELSNIQIRTSTNVPPAEPFIKIAENYPKTAAGARALLIAGGYLFEAGKYDQAEKTFGRFLTEYPENLLANQASLGVAASFEAEGNITNAVARYEDLLKRHQADSTTPQAKSALARLYVAENKPEKAVDLYEDLSHTSGNDTWSSEASIQLEELFAKYPKLRKTNSIPAISRATATVPMPVKK